MKANLAWLISRLALTRPTLTPTILAALTLSMLFTFNARASDPQVSNVQASQRTGTKLVDITYDVTAIGAVTISATVSTNSGSTYDLPATSFSGSGYGAGVTPGTGKAIVWDAGADWDGHYSTLMRVKVTADDGSQPTPLPPDPSTVATAPSNGVVTLIGDSTAFLYTGTNSIQTGVATGTINAVQAAVLRGRVLDRAGAVLSGVTVSIEGHSEFGRTFSRTNGIYDLAVNGGSTLCLNFTNRDYLAVQRVLVVPPQEFVMVDDVTLIPADTNLTVINLTTNTEMQVALGSVMSDANGVRQAVVMIPTGVVASIITYGGVTQTVSTLTTRFTEFTVGSNGLSAMPGDLPDTVAYTYAIELGALEAQAKVAGRDVLFSTTVYFYVDNFLGMPAGIQVPMAYYDNTRGAWVPSDNGRVIQLLGTNVSGLAKVCVNTNGTEADTNTLATLGFTDMERLKLAQQYAPAVTQSLWRVPITHFSRYDLNYGQAPATGSTPPNPAPPTPSDGKPVDNGSSSGGSGLVEIEPRVFHESMAVEGTPFMLQYSSERVPGYKTGITIPITGTNLPAPLKYIMVNISFLGRKIELTYAPQTNLSYELTWDGYDAYGRLLEGRQAVEINIGYAYDSFYALPPYMARSFGYPSGEVVPGWIPTRRDAILWQRQTCVIETPMGRMDARTMGLGGWTLNEHHLYDPVGRILYQGNGNRRSASGVVWGSTVNTIAGTGSAGFSGDSGSATAAQIKYPKKIGIKADGTIVLADCDNYRIRQIDTNGIITTIAGTGTQGHTGDGGPALNAQLAAPYGVSIGPDGSIYITELSGHTVRKIDANGIITTVAGMADSSGYSGDGGPATQARLSNPIDVVVARDGTFYVSEYGNFCVRQIGPDGTIYTLAGTNSTGSTGDGGPARLAKLNYPYGLALGPDGSLYIADSSNNKIRRVTPDGIINTFAGTGTAGYSGDDGPATAARLSKPQGVAVAPDGSVYISEWGNYRIRRILPNGNIYTVAGTGNTTYNGEGLPALAANLYCPWMISIGPDNAIYMPMFWGHRVRKFNYDLQGYNANIINIPSEDGRLLYRFDIAGRHLSTFDTLTGATIYQFSYTNGYLAAIMDGDGYSTTVERNPQGQPTALVAPTGQRTTLFLNANGYLSSLANPAGNTYLYGYDTNGLMTSVTGPRGGAYTFTYDSYGRIVLRQDPEGGSNVYNATVLDNGRIVTESKTLGQISSYRTERTPANVLRRVITQADGASMELFSNPDGSKTNRYTDGRVTVATIGPDPRFNMLAPVPASSQITMPSGLACTARVTRAVSLASSINPLSLLSMTTWTAVNNRTNIMVFTASNRQSFVTTPAGRQSWITVDAMGRPVEILVNGLETVANTYDTRGRLESTTRGAGALMRTVTRHYNSDSFVDRITDEQGRMNTFAYDAVGRVTMNSLPGDRAVVYVYDAHGNRTSLTPPGRPAHTFTYTLVDLLSEYTPPAVGGATNTTYYTYNADRQQTSIQRPGGTTISNEYNAAGQLTKMSIPTGVYSNFWQTNGLLGAITAPSGVTISNTYDGSLVTATRWLGTVTGRVSRTYDNDFRVASVSVNGDNTVAYQYDADSLMTNAGVCGLSRNTENGLLIDRKLSNVIETLNYNTFGEVTNITVIGNGTNLFAVNYAFDKLGRVTNLTENIQSTNHTFFYTYDAAGRLSQVITNGGTNFYYYDSNGNRTNAVVTGLVSSAWYDDQDRLLSNSTASYGYNAAGDLTNKTVNGSNTVYQYDVLGNLLSVALPTGRTNEYLVDGMSRRVGKKTNGLFTNGFLYADGVNPVAELSNNTNLVSVFVYGSQENVPDYMIKDGVTYRIITDHLGSPRLVVQAATGEVVQRMDYDEFGRVVLDTNPGFQPFGFAGGLYDPSIGLIRFGARDYDQDTGRWLTRDPVGFAGNALNLYAYSMNDPVNGMDKYGLGPGNAAAGAYMAAQHTTGWVGNPDGPFHFRMNLLSFGERTRLHWTINGIQHHIARHVQYGTHYARQLYAGASANFHFYFNRTVMAGAGGAAAAQTAYYTASSAVPVAGIVAGAAATGVVGYNYRRQQIEEQLDRIQTQGYDPWFEATVGNPMPPWF